MYSSKGNQFKFRDGNYWYKKDNLGYESLAEVITSFILSNSNVSDFVEYKLCRRECKGVPCNFSKSKDFLKDVGKIVTLQRFFELEYGVELHREILQYMEITDRIKFVVDRVVQKTGLVNFGEYLTLLLEVDALTLDDDRHFNNIALVYDGEKYSLSPLFDFGASFLSDITIDYPMNKDCEELIGKTEAKPFSNNYLEQVDAAESLYGTQLKVYCSADDVCKKILRYCAYYESDIISRVQGLVREQWRKYQYLCYGADSMNCF